MLKWLRAQPEETVSWSRMMYFITPKRFRVERRLEAAIATLKEHGHVEDLDGKPRQIKVARP